ncbi:MAG: ferric reductase-like transmembrane domain-containing protein [Dehalococcoidia bacterium]|nr:ferric reductase-like transmembrane domain-containing protein [Dehalococcoidia bacterium]
MLEQRTRYLWLLVQLAPLIPLALLLWDATQNRLSANPIEAATLRTGKAALVLLIMSLSCTPIFNVVGFRSLLRLRRLLGLYAFFYAFVHLMIFVGVDFGFDAQLVGEGLLEKRYALAGLSAFILLAPLAITSTKGWRRRLGRRWLALHRAVYLAAMLAVLHYLWGVKANTGPPLEFGAILILLLLVRLPFLRQRMRLWPRK